MSEYDYNTQSYPNGSQAYFSAKAAAINGSSFWEDMDGKEVEITAVVGDLEYGWDDKVDRGLVRRWLRNGQPRIAPSLTEIIDSYPSIPEDYWPDYDDRDYIE